VLAGHRLLLTNIAWFRTSGRRFYASEPSTRAREDEWEKAKCSKDTESDTASNFTSTKSSAASSLNGSEHPNWEEDPDFSITQFSQLPHQGFGYNQHIKVNEEFKEALRQTLWQFRAPIRYAFAYGSGVFSQTGATSSSSISPHPHPAEAIVKWQKGGGKVIDFIFGVSHTQHWHDVNIRQHPDHYSFLKRFGSGLVSKVQDNWGAGVYFNPYITVNGTMIKYGVVNLDTLQQDLSQWSTLYLAGRLHKPVKILRDDPKVRLANQINLISALRTALLMLGPRFSEQELYTKIAGISYMGDPRMDFKGEDPNKVRNIVSNQLSNFRQLYAPLVGALPNVRYNDSRCGGKDWMIDPSCDCGMEQDMDPVRRGNMVRRLPVAFRNRIYMEYRKKWQIPGGEFNRMMEAAKDEDETGFKKREGSEFDRRIAGEDDISTSVVNSIRNTVKWPSWSQSVKGIVTAGPIKSLKYVGEKRAKSNAKKQESGPEKAKEGPKDAK
jgi:translocator assembly and maintenance protein 41